MTPETGSDTAPADPPGQPQRFRWLQCVLVLVLFLAYSAWCRPVPSVNEPHYLTKAKHYWQPEWCAGDFFLDSSNPHLVFYQTIGALTQWLTFPEAAWVGRIIALTLLAWGWTRLLSRLSPIRGAAVGTAALFLLLQALGNFSGEWLVGGVESKVLAYGLAFAGWASLMDRRLIPAAISLGLAMSFHPVVGVWCVIATAIALVSGRFVRRSDTDASPSESLGTWIVSAALLLVCALPGLVPAVQSLVGVDPEAAALADQYQVGVRLKHHLDPMVFPVSAYRYYALLLVIWGLLRTPTGDLPARRLFVRIVLASLVIAVVGIVVGWGPRPIQEMPLAGLRVWLLKFYPFRLGDLLLPMMVSLVVFERVTSWSEHQAGWRRLTSVVMAACAFALALWIPNVDKVPSRMSPETQADWIAACEWIRNETPEDSLLYAANEDWAVKWFTHRAEYANYKDCPQDAAGILEWVRRLRKINRWHRDAFRNGRISADELHQLHEETGITHLLVSRLGPVEGRPVYHNDSFRVYAIAPASDAATP